jgi:hypothetical protein
MAYNTNMAAAARRHLDAGERLYNTPRNDIAGYLFGVAAECAFKQMMINSGMRPSDTRRDDPFFAHFQELKTLVRDLAQGRLQSELKRYAENSKFLQYWDVSMRYSDGRGVKATWVDRWRADARDIIGMIDL